MIQQFRELTTAFAYESITVAGTAIGFTSATFSPTTGRAAETAVVSVEDAQIRYTIDGTTPTSTTGHLLNVGDVLELRGSTHLTNFLAIRTTSTSGTIKVTFYR